MMSDDDMLALFKDAMREVVDEVPESVGLDDTIAALRIIDQVLSSPPSGEWKP